MAEAATPAPAAPATPVPAMAAESAKAEIANKATTQPTETAAPIEKPKPDTNAAMLAQAKRLAAKAQAQEENAKRIIAQAEAFKTKAERYDYLEKLQKSDPIKFMEDTGMDFQGISKLWLSKTTGNGKTPQELVNEAVDKRLAEENKLREEQSKKQAAAEAAARDKQTFEGTMAEFARLAKADPVKFEVASKLSPGKVSQDAFTIMKNHFGQTKEVLSFDAALSGAEYLYKQEQLAVSFGIDVKDGTPTAELNQTWADRFKLKAEAEKAAARAKEAKEKPAEPTRKADQRPVVETKKPDSTPTPLRKRRPVVDYRKAALDLLAAERAKQDN